MIQDGGGERTGRERKGRYDRWILSPKMDGAR